MPAPRWHPTVTVRPQSVLVPSHISFFALIGCYPALLIVGHDQGKVQTSPKSDRVTFTFLAPFLGPKPRSAGWRRGLRRRSRKPCPAGYRVIFSRSGNGAYTAPAQGSLALSTMRSSRPST